MENKVSFEEAMNRLDSIVNTLERNEISIEEALKLFEEGLSLVKQCDTQLKSFEEKANTLLKEFEENA